MLYNSRDQLAMDLCYLVKEDSQLLNDVIYNYCQLIPNNQFNDLEEYCSQERRSILWLNVIITECNEWLTYTLFSFIILNVNERELISPLFNNNCSSTIY